jgi:hypothetical protein
MRVRLRLQPDQRLALSMELSAARMEVLGMLKTPPYGPLRSSITKRTLLSEMAVSVMAIIDNILRGATRPNKAKIIISQMTTT